MWSLVSATIRPSPYGAAYCSANALISSQPARAFTAKCRSKLSIVVSRIPLSTDSQCDITSACTGPSASLVARNTSAGAAVSSKSPSTENTRAPCFPSNSVISSRAAVSWPHGIRSSYRLR